MNLNYIQINNNNIKNKNYIRMPITPTMINYKINNLISPINMNNNYNYQISEYNGVRNKNFEKNILDYNHPLNNKIKNLQEYSAAISLVNKNIQGQNSSSNINKLKHKKNISLNKIQNEIKMIEMKLRSDIIKNKIKQLSNISEDNKNKIPFNRKNYMNKTNKIYNYNNIKNNNFNYINKNSFIQQRNKERKTYKIRKIKLNDNNGSRNFIFIKKKIDSKNNKINNTDQNVSSSKSSLFDKSACLNNNNYKLYSAQIPYQNNTSKINKNTLKKQYRKAINAKINNLFENKKKLNIINMKNIFNNSYINEERFLPYSQSFVTKTSFNENNNININDDEFSGRNLFNDISDINLDDSGYYNHYKPKSFIENINIRNIRKNNVKNIKKRNEYKIISDDLPQGSFDNYFINKYNIENKCKTNIYNTSNDLNIKDNKVNDFKIENYNNFEIINQKNILEKNNEIRDRKENIDNNNYFKKNDNDNENNKDKLKNHFISNNSIINTINFSFNPIKVNFNKETNLESSHGHISTKIINSDRDYKINKSDIKNSREKINNQQIQNNNIIIENYINKYTSQKESKENEKSKEIKDDNNDICFTQNKNNNDEQKELEDKDTESKQNTPKVPLIDPNELGQKTVILNNSIDILEENNDDNNILNKKRKVTFDDKKMIIEYNQNDYIKKSYVFANKNLKKIKHIFISTKEHIKNLKKENNQKSILKKENKSDDDALLKLNELISEFFVDKSDKNKKNENEIEKSNKKDGKNDKKATFIKKNINYIKKMQDNNKKGLKYKVESKSEIKLLKKKKKALCVKFQNNPQNFYTVKLNNNIMKSFGFDDSDILKLNIEKKLSNIQNELTHKMNNSKSGELQIKKLVLI